MLFNSHEFIVCFLPAVLAGYFALARAGHRLAALWLAAASLFFYGWWNPAFVLLLLASIAFNYAAGYGLARARGPGGPGPAARRLLAVAVTVDLSVLAYFKYTNFFLDAASRATGTSWGAIDVVLPLGISFFTFTQIAFLVDAYKGVAREYDFIHYALFVTYFPHLIAGPVLHHRQMMPQFDRPETYAWNWSNVNAGATIFVLGLFKKVVLADQMAIYANLVFDAPPGAAALTIGEAWIGALAYALQLYFDFSGYSDMAVGISLLFNVELPLNFHSPYKSRSIIDFWRRWHMTLSAFLKDYLYIPLGGNRHGAFRRYWSLGITMLLGGLWHGAAWTFVFWGALHGLYLMVNHGWRALGARIALPGFRGGGLVAGALTFLAVVFAWVPFRARDLEQTFSLWSSMLGGQGLALPGWFAHLVPLLDRTGIDAGAAGIRFVALPAEPIAWLALCLAIAWLMPNTVEWVGHHGSAGRVSRGLRVPPWRPTARHATAVGAVFALCLGYLGKPSPFLYFQF